MRRGGMLRVRAVAVLGLAFKAETDDMRDSPALDIIPALLESGAQIKAYDPGGDGAGCRCSAP